MSKDVETKLQYQDKCISWAVGTAQLYKTNHLPI